ncbi:MAG: type III-A CRISPR-associated protein Csm2 [Nitrospirae bacterium]|nr:type III-A CRISPR-associated protein Csm2 [Nitrospirota bacterium]
MSDKTISDAINKAKKYNVALRAITFNTKTHKHELGKNLPQAENDYKIKFNDDDQKTFLKKRDVLKKDLSRDKLHEKIINCIPQIFQFEKKKKIDGKEVFVSTKEAAQLLNDSSELMGLLLKAYGISTSQIRRYLDSLRRIKSNEIFNPSDVLLQQVKVAYAAGRDSDLTFLYEVMKPAITEGCKEYHYFEHLLRFVEAIVAYHRFYKGED